MCQGFSHFKAFLDHFVLAKLATTTYGISCAYQVTALETIALSVQAFCCDVNCIHDCNLHLSDSNRRTMASKWRFFKGTCMLHPVHIKLQL